MPNAMVRGSRVARGSRGRRELAGRRAGRQAGQGAGKARRARGAWGVGNARTQNARAMAGVSVLYNQWQYCHNA